MDDIYVSTAEIDRRERVAEDAALVKTLSTAIGKQIEALSVAVKVTPPDSPFYDALDDLLGDLQSAQDGLQRHLNTVESGRYA